MRVFKKNESDVHTCDHRLIRNWIREGGKLSKNCLMSLLMWTRELCAREPNLVRVDGNVAIVGDIHGQLYDLFYMLEKVKDNSRGI